MSERANFKPYLLYAILSNYYTPCFSCLMIKPRVYSVYLSDPLKELPEKDDYKCEEYICKHYNIVKNISKIIE